MHFRPGRRSAARRDRDETARAAHAAPRRGVMACNDWYDKHKKDVAAALKKGMGAARDGAVDCSLIRLKDGSFVLCAHVSGSKQAAMVKEARAAGGKVLSAGALFKGDAG